MTATVGLAGLTGKFAQCIAKTLLADPRVSIRGYCRNARKLPEALLNSPRIEVIEGESNDLEAARKFVHGTDVVICCYFGGADLMVVGQKILIDACDLGNVPRYIAGDFGVDHTKIPTDAPFPKESTRIITEYLKSKNVQGVHILVGALMETFWSAYFQLYDAKSQTLSYWGTGNEAWELTTFQTAADYTAAIALDPKSVGVFRFLSDRKTPVEIKHIYDSIYGSQLNLKCLGSTEELTKNVYAAAKSAPDDLSKWGANGFTLWCINGKAYLGELDNKIWPQVHSVDLVEFFKTHPLDALHKTDETLGF
ncbi:hypothetical protein ACEPPN_009938 [Leptodophora sp. 'Broadleaf-Isolate-01']